MPFGGGAFSPFGGFGGFGAFGGLGGMGSPFGAIAGPGMCLIVSLKMVSLTISHKNVSF